MKKVPIVFACDENYAMPFAVAMESLLATKADSTFYDIYCLIPEALSNGSLEKLKQLDLRYTNFELAYITLNEQLKNIEMSIDHISYVTYYRLLIPELLMDYEKVLYLDIDIIIKTDLSILFSTNLGNYYLGAVKHPDLSKTTRIDKYYIPSDSYFNVGVLLMNLSLLRKDNKQQEFIRLINENLPTQDQDILNVSCAGKVQYINMKYNMMTKFCYFIKRCKTFFVCDKEFDFAKEKPCIIHYADKEKPWDYVNLHYNSCWDNNYVNSVFYDENMLKNRKSLNYLIHNMKLFYNETINFTSMIKRSLLKIKVIYILNNLKKKITGKYKDTSSNQKKSP